MKKELQITLSASKIKTAQSCSQKYFTSYILHLPDKGNDGSRLGGLTHVILECLAVPRRRKLAEKIIEQKDPFHGKSCQGIKKLVYKQAHKLGIASDENIEKIKAFIVNGLSHDFWGESRGIPTETYTEKDFDILENGRYKIRGFIDRLFIYADGHALIRDYKSSKETYKGHEASNENPQASSYCVAVRKLFPHVKSISVEFLFLKFDCNGESSWETGFYQGRVTKKLYHNGFGKITLNYDFEEIEGFEYELESHQQYLESFTEESAGENYAADQPEPADGSFGGKLCCGFSKFEGQLKNDGNLMFACSSKYAFDYYFITKDDKWVRSCFLNEMVDLVDKYPPPEYHWKKRSYEGCPKWKNRS